MLHQLQDIGELSYMSKIANAFNDGKAFIGFLTAGDPTVEKTIEYILAMEEAGRAVFLCLRDHLKRSADGGSLVRVLRGGPLRAAAQKPRCGSGGKFPVVVPVVAAVFVGKQTVHRRARQAAGCRRQGSCRCRARRTKCCHTDPGHKAARSPHAAEASAARPFGGRLWSTGKADCHDSDVRCSSSGNSCAHSASAFCAGMRARTCRAVHIVCHWRRPVCSTAAAAGTGDIRTGAEADIGTRP